VQLLLQQKNFAMGASQRRKYSVMEHEARIDDRVRTPERAGQLSDQMQKICRFLQYRWIVFRHHCSNTGKTVEAYLIRVSFQLRKLIVSYHKRDSRLKDAGKINGSQPRFSP
jgi:hypothetical protein